MDRRKHNLDLLFKMFFSLIYFVECTIYICQIFVQYLCQTSYSLTTFGCWTSFISLTSCTKNKIIQRRNTSEYYFWWRIDQKRVHTHSNRMDSQFKTNDKQWIHFWQHRSPWFWSWCFTFNPSSWSSPSLWILEAWSSPAASASLWPDPTSVCQSLSQPPSPQWTHAWNTEHAIGFKFRSYCCTLQVWQQHSAPPQWFPPGHRDRQSCFCSHPFSLESCTTGSAFLPN